MQYDPIKRSLGHFVNRIPLLRILFYHLLDLLLLRTWHVKKALRQWHKETPLPFRGGVGGGVPQPLQGGAGGGIRILDAGSGFGQYTHYLSRLFPGALIDAVDMKEEQIADCTRFFLQIGKREVRFAVADLTAYTKLESYDLILSVDVMEHILEDERVFRNFYTSLRPGGMVLISTPSDQGGSDVHDHEEEHSFIDEHVRDGYNINDITDKLARAGFMKTEAQYTYGRPGQLGWRLSMKFPIRLLNVSKLFFILLPFYYLVTFPAALICNALDVRLNHMTGTGLLVKAYKLKNNPKPET